VKDDKSQEAEHSPNLGNLEANPGWFTHFIAAHRSSKQLILQPRMGFASPKLMRSGLLAVKNLSFPVAGTITLDSYTRVNDHQAAYNALINGHDLNGFPIVAHGSQTTRRMLKGILSAQFPVQVRHGSPLPLKIIQTMLSANLDATEGGPISYCLPYSRIPLRQAINEWGISCALLASEQSQGKTNHLESFAGCMLGQLCPPSLLIALSILEGLFFRYHGLKSISLSYAQQTNLQQDCEAVRALRFLAASYLHDLDWHIVIYTYMGVYPRTIEGAIKLLQESVQIALQTDSERLIIKTAVEATRIPTIAENVAALEVAAAYITDFSTQQYLEPPISNTTIRSSETYAEAHHLIKTVLDLHADPGEALAQAFEKGLLDIPFCLHPNNCNLTRSFIDEHGWLRWANPGFMPLPDTHQYSRTSSITSQQLLTMLTYNERRFDQLQPLPGSIELQRNTEEQE
jgi:methylaspartate mutase epsilon subunit